MSSLQRRIREDVHHEQSPFSSHVTFLCKIPEERKARKYHQCSFCLNNIRRKEKYYHWENMSYKPTSRGGYEVIKLHNLCYNAVMRLSISRMQKIYKEVFQ